MNEVLRLGIKAGVGAVPPGLRHQSSLAAAAALLEQQGSPVKMEPDYGDGLSSSCSFDALVSVAKAEQEKELVDFSNYVRVSDNKVDDILSKKEVFDGEISFVHYQNEQTRYLLLEEKNFTDISSKDFYAFPEAFGHTCEKSKSYH